MNEGFYNRPPSPAEIERKKELDELAERVMNSAETKVHFEKLGIKQLKTFTPNTPVVFVFDEGLRTDLGAFGMRHMHERPTFAVLHAPTYLQDVDPLLGENGLYGLANENGDQVDYYVIDKESGIPKLIRSTHSVMPKKNPYRVRLSSLYEYNPSLFEAGDPESS